MIIPGVETKRPFRIVSPRLVHPEQVKDFEMEVAGENERDPVPDPHLQPILAELRTGLKMVLGEQVRSIYLYGSQARNEAHPDSDIDVLVVVDEVDDYGDLIERTSALTAGLSLKYDVVISRTFVSPKVLAEKQSPFYINVRREGIPV